MQQNCVCRVRAGLRLQKSAAQVRRGSPPHKCAVESAAAQVSAPRLSVAFASRRPGKPWVISGQPGGATWPVVF
jgi:hypothetical protein